MNRLLIVTLMLGLFSPGIYAQNYNPKFNEGPDLAEFLKAATEDPSRHTNMPLPAIELEAKKATPIEDAAWERLKKEFLNPKAGCFGCPYGARVHKSEVYQNGQTRPPLLSQYENQFAYALLGEWNDINVKRNGLLNDAGQLDAKDSGLYAERIQINNAAAALNKERDEYKAAAAAYSANCPAGQPSTPACTNEYNRLVKWYNDLANRVAIHNQKVETWKSNFENLKIMVSAWLNKVQGWEAEIAYFIRKADAFLKGHPICVLDYVENEPIDVGQPPQEVYLTRCNYVCGTDNHWWGFLLGPVPTLPYLPCPKVVMDGEAPIKSVQRQSPAFTGLNKLPK